MKEDSVIFVFGSNLRGYHGAGAARDAVNHWGAKFNAGVGRQGYAYAIPTKNEWMQTLHSDLIEEHVKVFLDYARLFPHLDFQVTRIGCGLAGYKDEQIAPMFKGAPPNVHLPLGWRELAS